MKKHWPLALLVVVVLVAAACVSIASAQESESAPVCYVTQELRGEEGTTALCVSRQSFEEFPGLRVHIVNDDRGQLINVIVEEVRK